MVYIPQKQIAWLLSFSLALLGVLFVLAPAHAASGTVAISQGFTTNETNLVTGTLVGLSPGSQSSVQLSNTDRVNQMVGVIGDKPLIELSNSDQKQVQVVTSGTTSTLVSDINGKVKSGDKVTASPINGVGMKATDSSLVVGTAQADLSSVAITRQTIANKHGSPQTVEVGVIPVQVNVTYYFAPAQASSFLPPFLQSVANAVAGKDVSPVRVLISAVVMAFGFVGIAVLLYSSTRSSIISIGRNPLSEGAVRKSQLEVGATSLGILLVMLIAIYLILTS